MIRLAFTPWPPPPVSPAASPLACWRTRTTYRCPPAARPRCCHSCPPWRCCRPAGVITLPPATLLIHSVTRPWKSRSLALPMHLSLPLLSCPGYSLKHPVRNSSSPVPIAIHPPALAARVPDAVHALMEDIAAAASFRLHLTNCLIPATICHPAAGTCCPMRCTL